MGMYQNNYAIDVGVTPLETAFKQAKSNGMNRPFVKIDKYRFNLAPDNGRNPGAVYVRVNHDYVGKIMRGRFIITGQLDDYDRNKILIILDNPVKALEEYGRRTGFCGICGRTLTNHESIERGIGPICAGKMGF